MTNLPAPQNVAPSLELIRIKANVTTEHERNFEVLQSHKGSLRQGTTIPSSNKECAHPILIGTSPMCCWPT